MVGDMKSMLFGITWGSVEALRFFVVLAMLLVILVVRAKKRAKAITLLAVPDWRPLLLQHHSKIRPMIKIFLMASGLTLLFLTLLHPRWGNKDELIKQQGRDLFIALDISGSMLAQDIKPNRLEAAKEKIKALVRSLQAERVGLLLFSGSAVMQCPLTTDKAAFFMALDAVNAQTITGGTTALDSVIEKIITVFQAMPSKKNKIVALFTDGEDFSSDLTQIKLRAQQLGITLFTIGVGTAQGAPVPMLDEDGAIVGMRRDDKGAVVISSLHEGILHTLAADTGGHYISIAVDDSDVRSLVGYVQSYEKEQFEDKKVKSLEEQYPYFLAVSLLCLALEWVL